MNSQTQAEVTLEPCPCCKGEAFMQDEHWREGTLRGREPICRSCGLKMPRYWPGRKTEAIAAWTTRPTSTPEAGEAVAWRYTNDGGSVELLLDCNGEPARRLIELGWTEQPLFTALRSDGADELLREAREAFLNLLSDARDYHWEIDGDETGDCSTVHVISEWRQFAELAEALGVKGPRYAETWQDALDRAVQEPLSRLDAHLGAAS